MPNPYPTPLPPCTPSALEMFEAHVAQSQHDYHAYTSCNTHCRSCTTPAACDQAVRCAAHPDQTDDTTLVSVLGSVEL